MVDNKMRIYNLLVDSIGVKKMALARYFRCLALASLDTINSGTI